jgi:hypothetical protein
VKRFDVMYNDFVIAGPKGDPAHIAGDKDVVDALRKMRQPSAQPGLTTERWPPTKISFTGSTAVGKAILRAGAETMKRITLELGGKSPTIILDDANLAQAIPLALGAGFMNSGVHTANQILPY